MGFSKLKKWPKSIQECRRYKPKRVAVAFSRGKVAMRNLRMFCIWPRKGTSACFGQNLYHPWMYLNHFFNFENPISIFYKFYFVNVFIQSFWKELQPYQSVSMLLKNQYFIKMLALFEMLALIWNFGAALKCWCYFEMMALLWNVSAALKCQHCFEMLALLWNV